MQRELPAFSRTRDVLSSQLRRGVYLFKGSVKAKVEPDGTQSWVHDGRANKLVFGRSSAEVFKIQSGVKIAQRPQDLVVRASPTAVSFISRGQEKLPVTQAVGLVASECQGSARNFKLTNRGDSVVRVRLLTLHDPTSLNYRRERDPPGEIGVNAFNRHDQVVMDDVGDSTGVRVVGFWPRPSIIYMTKEKGRAAELLSLGELPESSSGMSGSVILLTQHDFELPPGATSEVQCVSVYHPSSLETALSAAAAFSPSGGGSAASRGGYDRPSGFDFSSSNPSVNFAYDWAKAALSAVEAEADLSEALQAGVALSVLNAGSFERVMESAKAAMRKDGALPNRGGNVGEAAGPAETSLFLVDLCAYLSARAGDKKLLRKWYPSVKKAADGLCALASGGLIPSSPDSPDGWRRRLGAGFPTGYVAEVNLLATRALRDAATVAYLTRKGSESARFREHSQRLLNGVNERLRDSESGTLALNVDGRGVVHKEAAVDQAVGLSYYSPDANLASSTVHRLLEKDFETGYGPRTVPSSNVLYFSPVYGDGQLGGYWPRASLSHALLAYHSGYPSIGSSQLEKIAKLVHLEAEKFGGVPGEFPYWMDPDRRQILSSGSDPVAAARFVEALVFGELGLSIGPQGVKLRVAEASQLKWLLVHDLDAGVRGSVFVGRSGGKAFVATTVAKGSMDEAKRTGRPGGSTTSFHLAECEPSGGPSGLEYLLFWDADASLLCVGNTGSSGCAAQLSLPLKSKAMAASLFAQVEELQQETVLWGRPDRVRLAHTLELAVELGPSSWKMLRITPFRG